MSQMKLDTFGVQAERSLNWVSLVRTIEFDAELPPELIEKLHREFQEWHKRTGGTIFEWMDEKRKHIPNQSD
ncbi:hypothetical protein [Dethiobacter alkaliphilus]|uniref:hypothetical protein n=1 Tax=Dethiobacter alkaliphilus TaxID=427926 RepID=UPI002227D1D0|nr:hypothetical protein [Dethiobacter alkaliphilus]MCW3491525.1 hypothetical protein [Dethiobacter alkaliphilus]